MRRWLSDPLKNDLQKKLVLLSGPRQVGKTTLGKSLYQNFDYLNFDSAEDRRQLMRKQWNRSADLVIFDELHKMKKWKSWIKGVYDTEKRPPALLVTGSARLDTYKKGGDSLAGRHFTFRLHPFTVKELSGQVTPEDCLQRLLTVGGFPEPFLKNSVVEARRWRRGHLDVILREDLLDLEKVRNIKSIEILIDLLRVRVGSTVSYSSLAEDLQVSIHTVKMWLQILENLYVIFPVRTYHKNIARSILKDTKYYFFDNGQVEGDDGQRLENVVACALWAELQAIEDLTGQRTALHFLRDKEKREIDFLTVVQNRPTAMVEVKWSDREISRSFSAYFKHLGRLPAFQVVRELSRPISTSEVSLVAAAPFLANLSFLSSA